MEKKIDIIPFLEGIVEENTRSYQSDFSHDERRLQGAMLEANQENRTFLWMSRPCGTWCFLERDTFLRDTPAHTIWTNNDYIAEADQIKAYRIIVAPGHIGDFVLGKIQPLNYGQQVERVKRFAIPVHQVTLDIAGGEIQTIPFSDFSGHWGEVSHRFGKIEAIRYQPENEAELSNILQTERMISAAKKRLPRKKKPATR